MVTLALVGALGAMAQTPPDWRRVGGSALDLELAAPATGPVARVWFSADGSALYARTPTGKVFHTADFETWAVVANAGDAAADAAPPAQVAAARVPEPGVTLLAANSGSPRIFALGRQLWGSGDGGHTWLSLTSYKAAAVVGPGQNNVAVSPLDDRQIVLANDYGVWRSMDGGLSWDGLNTGLPNLSVARILSTPSGVTGARIETDRREAFMLPHGGSLWTPTPAQDAAVEARALKAYSDQLNTRITAVGAAGVTVYAGGANGRMWVREDNGHTLNEVVMPSGSNGQIERIFVDPARPWVALAIESGKGPRVMRTAFSGRLWDVLDGNLPADATVNGITADPAAGAIYLATSKGVFYAHADLESSATDVAWTNLSDRLPAALANIAATDVKLDPAGVQLYAALDGYGIYATPAPHRTRSLSIVSTADYTIRPAAPGSLLSVIGARVNTASGGSLNYPVLAAAETESQLQVPFDAEGPNVSLRLETPGGPVTRGLAVQPVSPAILVGREGVPMLWDADTGLPIDARNTAHSNGRMQIWATGLGKVHPDWPAGLPAPADPPEVNAQVRVFLDGAPIQVTKATLVPGYVGFYLVEVQLPSINNLGPSELYIAAGGQESNRVQVILEP